MNRFKLIIGLGNPDAEYAQTYHNVGHQFIDFLIQDSRFKIQESVCLKTNVYMNESGKFVKEALKKARVQPHELLVVHDDADIILGRYKISFGRNSAGHRGAQNVIDQLKTNQFCRLRIGIRPASTLRAMAGKARKQWIKADALVLKKISPAAHKQLNSVFKEVIKIL